jgi:HD-like signal output (HDOD) protein
VTTDLGDVRAAVKQALETLRETPDESVQLLWLVPFTPKRILRRIGNAMGADPDHPVFCSNLGDLGFLVLALASNEAEYAIIEAALDRLHLIRVSGQNLTRQLLERTGGQMMLQSWRIGDKIAITIEAYQPGAKNTKNALRELAGQTLAEFDLTGEID